MANHLKSKGAAPALRRRRRGHLVPGRQPGRVQRDPGPPGAGRLRVRVADGGCLGTDRIFLLGDFNAYTHEDPMQVLYTDGYTDLGSAFDPSEATYSFNGLQGSLDHVLANPAAKAMVTGADVWQINAQEAGAYNYSRYNYNATQLFNGTDPFAASDHDPVIVGLNLPATPVTPSARLERLEGVQHR
ncbi:endonuclease/exonuclease/phosphatase family protein [Streptosporangium lutulentum]